MGLVLIKSHLDSFILDRATFVKKAGSFYVEHVHMCIRYRQKLIAGSQIEYTDKLEP